MDRKGFIELVKSFGRFVYFGALGLVATFLADLAASGDLSNIKVLVFGQTVDLSLFLVVAIGFVIKAIDRYRHASEQTSSNGLAPRFLQR